MINDPNSPTQGILNSGFPPQSPDNLRHNRWAWIIGLVAVVLIVGTTVIFALTRTGTNTQSQANTQATATTTNNTPIATSATPAPTSDLREIQVAQQGVLQGGPLSLHRRP